jgi:hypothetical protein
MMRGIVTAGPQRRGKFSCHDPPPVSYFMAMKQAGKGNGSGHRPAGYIGFAALVLGLCAAAPGARAQTGQVVNGYGLCLQVTGAVASGSRVQSANCVPNAANQTFTRTAINELRISGTLCVDAYGGGKQAAEVGLWTCQNSPNERWAPNNGFLVTENNFCLAVDGGNRTPGTRVIVYSCMNDPSQKWTGPAAARPPVTSAPPPAPRPTPVAPPVANPTAMLDPGNLSSACQMLFGRDCSSDETAYVRGAPPSNWVSRDAVMAFLRAREVVSSPSIRDAIVTRAADLTYGAGAQICTEAWTYLRASFTPNATNVIGTSWNSFQQLYYSMNGQPAMLPAVVNNQCKGAAPKVPGTAFDTTVAQNACQSMLGRVCQSAETAQLGSAVGGNNLAAMQNYIRDKWISASPSYKDAVILAAYTAAMGAGKNICTEEMNDLRARFATNPQPGVSWSGFGNLAAASGGQPALVQSRSSLCVAPPPPPAPVPTAAGPVSQNAALMSMISNSYVTDFGRAARADELSYWGSMKTNDSRVATRDAFLRNDIAFLKSSQPERQAMIQAAYRATWGVTIALTSTEMKFWEPRAAQGQIVYSGLKNANDAVKATNPTYVPGQPLKAAMNQPGGYSLQGIQDPFVAAWRTLATLLQTDYASLATNLTTPSQYSGPTPPAAASLPPAVSPLPAMRIPNPRGIAGPFVIATTYHENPSQSFCLDTGSWASGSPVVAVPCHGGDSQLFNMNASGQIYLARTPNGQSLCLDGGDKPWGIDPRKKQVVLNTCSNQSTTQQWYGGTIPGMTDGIPGVNAYWPDNRQNSGMGQIQNRGNGYCIDLANGATGASNPVIAYDCVPLSIGNPRPWNQVWGAGHIMTTGAAYLFMRYNPPMPAGHVGWGIQLADGSWEGGTMDGAETGAVQLLIWNLSTPGAVAKGDNNYAWRHHFATEQALRDFFLHGNVTDTTSTNNHYDRYWKVQLSGGVINTAAVFSLESQSWDWGYGVLGNNCMDITYKILRAYGWNLAEPAHSGDLQQYAPKNWFTQVVGSPDPLWLHGQ